MANPPNLLREIVSGQRKRYTEDGFNLDLSYITPNIIAMGFPAESMEAIYRNKREDVLKFLDGKHGNKYKVYNLCSERTYPANLFPNYADYPFKDHNPPDVELMNNFCEDVHNFLRADSSHVVAIHCKAGKGRTGTMICCYLLYSNTFRTANEALTYYAEKRTKDKKGVTIPSQRRYVEYYEQLLRNRLTYKDVALYVVELRISPADVPLKTGAIKHRGIKDSLPLQEFQRSEDYVTVTIDRCMPLIGDVEVEFTQASKLQEKRWHFWFNTFFVERAAIYDSQNRLVLTLDKKEIDDAHKGNARKCPEQVQVFLKPVPPTGKYSETLDGERRLATVPQPSVDGNPMYAIANNHHHHYQQLHQAQQRHHPNDPSSKHNPALIPSANFADPQLHHRGTNNNRASLGNSQQNSGIYCNIGPDLGKQQQQQQQQQQIQPQTQLPQQQQQHQHVAVVAASSPSSKQGNKKNAIQQKQTHHQQQLLNHSGGSSEEISGTDSVEEEDDEEHETEEGWDSGECQTVVSQTMCKSRTTVTTSATTANTTSATTIVTTTATPSTTTPITKSNQTSSSNPVVQSLPPASTPPEVAVSATAGAAIVANNKSCLPRSPSSTRRCLSDSENYLLTRISCGVGVKSSKCSNGSSLERERELCSNSSIPTNQTLNQSCALHPVEGSERCCQCTTSKIVHDAALWTPDGSSPSLALMLYDARTLPFGYGAIVTTSRNDDCCPEESQMLSAITAQVSTQPGDLGASGMRLLGSGKNRRTVSSTAAVVPPNVDCPTEGIEDVAISATPSGCGGLGGSAKFSSPSPFRRFGMVMRRRKKRSLKMKHHGSGGNGVVVGGNSLYGSCASNLSGVSLGNGSAKGAGTGPVVAANSGNVGTSGSAGRTKLKFRWLRNMRTDPNLKETLAKNVQLRTTTTTGTTVGHSGDSIGGTEAVPSITTCGVTIPRGPTTEHQMSGPNPANAAGELVECSTKVAGSCNLPTDYYSFLCDNQLSYESPSKSPGHLMRLEQLALARRPSTIEETFLQPVAPSTPTTPPPASPSAITVSDADCSVVRPRASNVTIGFNVSPAAPASPVLETIENLPSSIDSSFEIIEKADALATVSAAAGCGPLGTPGVGHRICNKLLQHIVTTVGSGRKVDSIPAPECDRGLVPEQPSIIDMRRSSSSSSSLSATVPPPVPPVPDSTASPILARSNRCAPFSFRELSAELRAAIKIPTPKHRSHATVASSSASSSSSNVTGGLNSSGGSEIRSIERTLSAPVAVQSLDIGDVIDASNFLSSATNTPGDAVVANATSSIGPLRALNRSLSDRQLVENRTDRR